MNEKEYQAAIQGAKEELRSARQGIQASSFSDRVKKALLKQAEKQYSKRLNEIEKLFNDED